MLDKTIVTQLAEWSTTFDIVGPWTLLKLPSDGSEHKCDAEVKKQQTKETWEKFLAALDKEYEYKKVLEKFENMILWQQYNNGKTREEALMVLYGKLNNYAQGKVKMYAKFDINNTENHDDLSRGIAAFEAVYFSENVTNHLRNEAKNWKDITATLMDNPLLGRNVDLDWVKKTVEESHRDFVKNFKRLPEQKSEDIKWLMDYIMNKQNAMCLNDLKPYTGKINEMKNYMDEHKFFNKEPNELAFNYSIWVVFIKNRDGNVNTISANTLAQDVVAIYNNFSEYFEY